MNRLADQKSPYLLQHAGNPVDWYPWGDEAFERARREDRPIFLSIGYSTCHWCHVMEHESFENAAVAELLNAHFVAIKVDREERPDVDRVYMLFVQATTGSGGWPMSVWLTPDLKPFFGGTYFPPESRWGRPGFGDILRELARAWRENRASVLDSAESVTAQLRRMPGSGRREARPGPDLLPAAVRDFAASFDRRRGGFGNAPKFPRPSDLLFLFREWARTGDEAARDMALRTLQAMAVGGMRDHIGGGFHRYAVDADWRVPHFEKMLYDQAQLVLAYLEAAQVTGEPAYAEIAEDTLQYVARDLSDPSGGFYSAEDADSVPPEQAADPAARKSEGAFYLWTHGELDALLGPDADLVRARFGVLADGNAPFDPQDEFGSKNLLYVARSTKDLAEQFGLHESDLAARLDRARAAMDAVRKERPRPQLDDKILSAWNGMMIAAFARASRVLGSARHLDRARRAASFMRDRLWHPQTQTLHRRFRDGEVAIPGYAEDYACAIWGALELFQADGDPGWLEWGMALQRRQDALFGDDEGGSWFNTTGHDPSVLIRIKEDYDGAEPAAASVSVANLLTLVQLTGDAGWRARIDRTLCAFAGRLTGMPRGVPMMLANLSASHAGAQQIVVVGHPDQEVTRQLAEVVAAEYRPFAVVVRVEPGGQQERLAQLLPVIGAMTEQDGRPTAYVCQDFACQQPTSDPDELRNQLRR